MATWKKVIVSGSDAHLNNITGSGLEISGIVSGSTISGSFVGDGSELTGVSATSFNIDGLSNGSAIIAGDKIFYSDAGTEKALPYEVLSSSIYGGVSGDITIAGTGVSTIGADTVANSMLENMTQGTVKVGGGSNAPTDLDAKTDGQILVGDGTDINSVAVSGDVTLANDGAVTIASNAVEGSMLNSNTAGGGLSYEVNSLNVDSGSFVAYMSSSAFSVVSGDIAIAAGGAATIQADSVQGTMLNDDVADDSTIEISSNNLSVLKVPNALTAGDGIDAGGTFDGANARTLSVSAAQTTITSVKHNSLVIGGNSQNNTIDFGTDDVILFDTDNTERMRVDAGGVDVTGALTVSTNATIEGNLVVNGDTTTLSTTNLAVGDQFIFTATGSAGTNVDSGLIIQSGSAVDSGSALYHDKNDQRWAVAKGISSITTAVTPLEHVVTVKSLGDNDAPVDGDKEYGVGEIAINSDGTIWIYS